jgi:CrcB protein
MSIWTKILLVGISGGIGAICRMLIGMCLKTSTIWMGLTTLVVNSIACLLIGIFAGWVAVAPWSTPTKAAFALITMTGFCGGFSTFSSFTYDGVKYFEAGQIGIWFIFGSLTIIIGLAACFAGYWLGHKL